MGTPTHRSSKSEWRARFRSYRRSLNARSYSARTTLIAHRALGVPAVAGAAVVHTYWPMADEGEVDTRPLIAALRGRGTTIVLPVVTSYDAATPTLEHRRYTGPKTLRTNRWGIPEPTDTERLAPDALDVVIVPAFGADRSGHRLGHGSGYYDVFLSSVSCPLIGLVYEECVTSSLPSASHDVPMTHVVTEQNVITIDR